MRSARAAARLVRAATCGLPLALLACHPHTNRPPFGPEPGTAVAVLELGVPAATTRLAEALRADSLPVGRVELRDGYLETPWFDTATGRPTDRRPLGAGVVRLRAWIDPALPGHSRLRVETVYRPLADPSLPDRELERMVAEDHPTAARVREVLELLEKVFGKPRPAPAPSGGPGSPGPRPAPRSRCGRPGSRRKAASSRPA